MFIPEFNIKITYWNKMETGIINLDTESNKKTKSFSIQGGLESSSSI